MVTRATLTYAQIVARACAIAKAPGFTTQAGQYLNAILEELAQDYDLELAAKTHWFTMNPGATALFGLSVYGSGPMDLPTDFLRMKDALSATYSIGDGVPRELIPCDITEFDQLVQQAGNQSYPRILAIDLSLSDSSQQGASEPCPQAYVWPPPSGSFAAQFRYYPAANQIEDPATSAVQPWFPNSTYLITRLAGELMKETDDDRWRTFLGDGPEGAQGILNRYLKNKDNQSNRAKRVRLDQRQFGGASFQNLPNTKTLGW